MNLIAYFFITNAETCYDILLVLCIKYQVLGINPNTKNSYLILNT